MILLFVLIGVGLVSVRLWEQHLHKQEAQRYEDESLYHPEEYSLELEGKTYRMRENVDAFLLVGLDKFSDSIEERETVRNNQQADFLFLMIVDHAKRTYTALHINRDTMCEIGRYGLAGVQLKSTTAQLALSHTYGSGGRDSLRHTMDAVSKLLLDVPLAHALSVTMDAVPAVNDLVGGVTVTVVDDFSNVDAKLVQGEKHRLKGQEALTYVRSRGAMDDKTNLNRMERQRVFLNGLYEQLNLKLHQDENFALRLASELSAYMVSDLSVDQLSKIAEQVKDYTFKGIETLDGNAVVGNGHVEFYVNENQLRDTVIRLFLTE